MEEILWGLSNNTALVIVNNSKGFLLQPASEIPLQSLVFCMFPLMDSLTHRKPQNAVLNMPHMRSIYNLSMEHAAIHQGVVHIHTYL